jgi:hypothetical protein
MIEIEVGGTLAEICATVTVSGCQSRSSRRLHLDLPECRRISGRCCRKALRVRRAEVMLGGSSGEAYSASFSLLFDSDPNDPSSAARSYMACPAAVTNGSARKVSNELRDSTPRGKRRTVEKDDRLIEIFIRFDAVEVTQLAISHIIRRYQLSVVERLARERVDLVVESVLDLEHPSHGGTVKSEKSGEESDFEIRREGKFALLGTRNSFGNCKILRFFAGFGRLAGQGFRQPVRGLERGRQLQVVARLRGKGQHVVNALWRIPGSQRTRMSFFPLSTGIQQAGSVAWAAAIDTSLRSVSGKESDLRTAETPLPSSMITTSNSKRSRERPPALKRVVSMRDSSSATCKRVSAPVRRCQDDFRLGDDL